VFLNILHRLQSLKEARILGVLGLPLGLVGLDINIVNKGQSVPLRSSANTNQPYVTSQECLENLKVNDSFRV